MSWGKGQPHLVATGATRTLPLTVFAAACGLMCLAHPVSVRADVLEIGQDGAVTVLAKPAVYTSEGVRPILGVSPVRGNAGPLPEISQVIEQAAKRQAVSTELVSAVAWQESRFRQGSLSSKGAAGVMQIMPATALSLGIDRFDLRQNIEGGAAYLRQMLDRYGGKVPLALAAYNAGPGAVDRFGGVPPFRETQAYVGSILGRLSSSAALYQPAPLLIEP